MRRSILCALAAAGMLVWAHAAASAQTSVPYVTSAERSVEPDAPRSAAPYGATYIPGCRVPLCRPRRIEGLWLSRFTIGY